MVYGTTEKVDSTYATAILQESDTLSGKEMENKTKLNKKYPLTIIDQSDVLTAKYKAA